MNHTPNRTPLVRSGAALGVAALLAGGLSVTAPLASGVPVSSDSAASGATTERAPRVVHRTDFSSDPGWTIVSGVVAPKKSKAVNMPFNVWYHDGVAQITTRRHCVKPGEAPTQANATGTPCRKVPGTTAVYTSGRIQTPVAVPRGKNFEIEFSALLPSNGKKGTRQALWANNTTGGGQYCDVAKSRRNIVEFDNLEWYGKKTSAGHHTTHLGCRPKKKVTSRKATVRAVDPNVWHSWKVRRMGRTITYWRGDGGGAYTKVATHRCGAKPFGALSKKKCKRWLGKGKWLLIAQGEVFKGSRKPDNRAWFPAQSMLVDWAEVRTL